ncbi:MAG: hypothetical protein COA63_005145 [Methylophaga sp.]|nr:hypothetical protein [Methylophaga sp.]
METNRFVTGIDDIGTMSGKSAGWSLISFHEEYFSEFNQSAQDTLNKSGLKSFHAKEFKRKKSEYYGQFLSLIKETLAKGNSSFICCTLLDEAWKNEFKGFCEMLIGDAFQQANIDNNGIIEASKRIAAPLFTYQRISSQKTTAKYTSIDIDRDSVLSKLNDNDLIIRGKKISSQIPIFASLNAYGRKQFPSAPLIEKDSINILNDEESFLIQAADIFGNFSTALSFKTLGKESKSNNLKCEIFENVYSDLIDPSHISDSVDLDGDDLVLKNNGSFTLCVS